MILFRGHMGRCMKIVNVVKVLLVSGVAEYSTGAGCRFKKSIYHTPIYSSFKQGVTSLRFVLGRDLYTQSMLYVIMVFFLTSFLRNNMYIDHWYNMKYSILHSNSTGL